MDTRQSWDATFMDMTKTLAQRSTCTRIQTAALLVKQNRIISMGYNGVTSKSQHCVEYFKERCGERNYDEYLKSDEFYKEHHEWANIHEIHGEQNAILYAAKIGVSTDGTVMYSLYAPCIYCAKVIATSGIQKVVYGIRYDRCQDGIKFLSDRGISCTLFEGNK